MRRILNDGQWLVLWVGLHLAMIMVAGVSLVLVMMGISLIGVFFGALSLPMLFAVLVVWGGIIGALLGGGQRAILKQHWRDVQAGWVAMTSLGTTLGILLTLFILIAPLQWLAQTMTLPELAWIRAYGALVILAPLLSISLLQALLLGRMVRNAWLWLVAHTVAGLAMWVLLLGAIQARDAFSLIAYALASLVAVPIVTGFSLIWMRHTMRR
jgi:hypothetical protein